MNSACFTMNNTRYIIYNTHYTVTFDTIQFLNRLYHTLYNGKLANHYIMKITFSQIKKIH